MTDHPNARDYANKAERAEQEATEAWACADRLAKALAAAGFRSRFGGYDRRKTKRERENVRENHPVND